MVSFGPSDFSWLFEITPDFFRGMAILILIGLAICIQVIIIREFRSLMKKWREIHGDVDSHSHS